MRPLLVLLVAAPLALADTDVEVPAGLPFAWSRKLPRPAVSQLGAVVVRRGAGGGQQGSVEVVGASGGGPPRPPQLAGSPLAAAGVTTKDLPEHHPWVSPPRRRDSRQPTPHFHWLAAAILLRPAIHPNALSPTLVAEHLIELAPPRALLRQALSRRPTAEVARAALLGIGDPEDDEPRLEGGGNAYQQALYRLALRELIAGHPHDPGAPWAQPLLALGLEGLPPVLDASRSRHVLLRRRATAALAAFEDPRAQARLRELLEDRDRVVRNRALHRLVVLRDREIVPELLRWLRKKEDPATQQLAIDALGRLGAQQALRPLRTYLGLRTRMADPLWVTLPAIARLATDNKSLAKQLAKIQADHEAAPRRYRKIVDPRYEPPPAERRGKSSVIAEMALLARASSQDPLAIDEVLRRMSQGRGAGGSLLRQFAPTNHYLLCDVLARLGARGHRRLRDLVASQRLPVPVRARALSRLDLALISGFLEALEQLGRWAREGDDGLLRYRAMLRLASDDADAAREVAAAIVADYAKGKASLASVPRDWVCLPALQLLARDPKRPPTPALLRLVIARADEERRLAAAQARDASLLIEPPALLETALRMLARAGQAADRAAFAERLASTKAPARAAAALALGALGGRPARAALLAALERLPPHDPWLDFCIDRALRQSGKREPAFVDWYAADAEARAAAVAAWRAQLAGE